LQYSVYQNKIITYEWYAYEKELEREKGEKGEKERKRERERDLFIIKFMLKLVA